MELPELPRHSYKHGEISNTHLLPPSSSYTTRKAIQTLQPLAFFSRRPYWNGESFLQYRDDSCLSALSVAVSKCLGPVNLLSREVCPSSQFWRLRSPCGASSAGI